MHVATQPSFGWKPAGPRRVSEARVAVKAAAGTGEDRGAGGGGKTPTTFHPGRSSFGRGVFLPKPQTAAEQPSAWGATLPLVVESKGAVPHSIALFLFFRLVLGAFSFGAAAIPRLSEFGAG